MTTRSLGPITAKLLLLVLLYLNAVLPAFASGYSRCSSVQFQCDNGRCIPRSWVCDLGDDCGDNSDETLASCQDWPGRGGGAVLQSDMMVAAVAVRWLVAGAAMTLVAADVLHVPTECDTSEFRCNNSRCIINRWQCDGADDCRDNSDEDPVVCADKQCRLGEYRCPPVGTRVRCIPSDWVCDGTVDCTGNHTSVQYGDEHNCPARQCKADEFACGNPAGQCIPASWLCDGTDDCRDASDEAKCSMLCSSDQFTCGDGQCVMLDWVCDGRPDCRDTSDETNCTRRTCNPDTHFWCGSGECMLNSLRCDGDRDCTDGTDEQDCMRSEEPAAPRCQPSQVACGDQVTCIFATWVCDGDVDCPDGSDESPDRCARPECNNRSEFLCGGIGECVSPDVVCDGKTDCRDGSDEDNCTHVGVGGACDADTQFTCTSGQCVPLQEVCNLVNSCEDGSDEGQHCLQDDCALANGGCSHRCFNLPHGYQCHCPLGYQLDHNQHTCIDTDECQRPGICSHKCINLKGTYKCECFPGYTLDPSNVRFCKANDIHASLILTHRTDIRKVGLHQRRSVSIVNDTKMAAAVDYDYRTGMLFWADLAYRAVYMAPIDDASSASSSRALMVSDITCEGLAVDWIHRHLYLIRADRENSAILLTDMRGGQRTTLVRAGLQQPRAIRVDPADGWMYWSDWGLQPRIERAGMDGSRRQQIVSSRLAWPNGLTLDLVRQRLYWTDAKLRLIESCDLDGGNRSVVISSSQVLQHPFSISTFEDSIFWTDWDRRAVFSANKFTGADVTSVASQGQVNFPVEVRVYHAYRQPASVNRCMPLNGRCSHLCLPVPRRPGDRESSTQLTTCACPDGLQLGPDQRRCYPDGATAGHPADRADGVAGKLTYSSEEGTSAGTVVGIVFGSLVCLLLVLCLLGFFLYRHYGRGFRSLNFDNPVYKKTTVDSVKLEKSRTPFSSNRNTEESLMPLTRSQEEA